jgi:hypothetical protein
MMLKKMILDVAEGMRDGNQHTVLHCGTLFSDQFDNNDAVIQLSVIHEQ